MSVPQNFHSDEQRILDVSSTSSNVQFQSVNSSAHSDLWIKNGGKKNCQILLGSTSATVAVQDASAGGTKQIKILAGESCVVKKDANTWLAAITEGTDTTILYAHIGLGS